MSGVEVVWLVVGSSVLTQFLLALAPTGVSRLRTRRAARDAAHNRQRNFDHALELLVARSDFGDFLTDMQNAHSKWNALELANAYDNLKNAREQAKKIIRKTKLTVSDDAKTPGGSLVQVTLPPATYDPAPVTESASAPVLGLGVEGPTEFAGIDVISGGDGLVIMAE